MIVVFRVDASVETGSGHVMRCLALADGLKAVGAHSCFLSRHMPGHLRDILDAKGHGFELLAGGDDGAIDDLAHSAWLGTSQRADAQLALQALSGKRCDWLVVDHYALDARWESAFRVATQRILVIDDLADRVHDCELLLDPSASADAGLRYEGRVPGHCRLMLGARHALLRGEFRQMRGRARPRDGRVKRILVFLGGVDAAGHTINAVDALDGLRIEGLKVDVVIGTQNPRRGDIESRCKARSFACHVQTDRMAELMEMADLAIGAGGSSTWERCCLGLPALTLCVAENQRRLVQDAALHGLIYAPDLHPADSDAIRAHLRALVNNPLLLQQISRNGLQAVDGRGTQRVLLAMGCGAITIRKAKQSDSSRILAWRNHPEVRGASGNPDVILSSTHEPWYAAALADPDRILLLGEHGEEAVGVVRFDVADGAAEVSIYLAPGNSGQGRGGELLRAAEAWLSANRADVRAIQARVLRDNQSSHKLFESCGYRKRATLYAKEVGRT